MLKLTKYLAQTVTRVSKALSKVRYVITADDTIVVNGVVASVFSTGAKSVETLPFHMLHKFAKGALQVCPPTEPSLPTRSSRCSLCFYASRFMHHLIALS